MANWFETIDLEDIWSDEDTTFEETRDSIVARFRDSRWYQNGSRPRRLIALLELTIDHRDFDSVFNLIYDAADNDRIWIKTFF